MIGDEGSDPYILLLSTSPSPRAKEPILPMLCLIGNKILEKGPLTFTLSTKLRRPYSKPAKKPPSKKIPRSAAAPEKDKTKSKTKPVSKAVETDASKPVKTRDRKTTLEVGTGFELRSLKLLQDNFSMALDRVAGPGDGGVDLVGWWWLPKLPGLPEVDDTFTQMPQNENNTPQMRSRIRVLAQCKAEKGKMGPNYVREMEGVLHRMLHSHSSVPPLNPASDTIDETNGLEGVVLSDPSSLRPIPSVAMLISQSRFTSGAVMRAMSSPIPFILLHLPPVSDTLDASNHEEETDEEEDQPSLQWNAALGSERGLLRGSLEVRWQREAGGSHPRLWWQGRPMETYVP